MVVYLETCDNVSEGEEVVSASRHGRDPQDFLYRDKQLAGGGYNGVMEIYVHSRLL